jgi:hypothetical protein
LESYQRNQILQNLTIQAQGQIKKRMDQKKFSIELREIKKLPSLSVKNDPLRQVFKVLGFKLEPSQSNLLREIIKKLETAELGAENLCQMEIEGMPEDLKPDFLRTIAWLRSKRPEGLLKETQNGAFFKALENVPPRIVIPWVYCKKGVRTQWKSYSTRHFPPRQPKERVVLGENLKIFTKN